MTAAPDPDERDREQEQQEPDAEEIANEELPLDPAGPTEFGEAVDD
jgi:hypothetical protein